MQHRPFGELAGVADLHAGERPLATRKERLERWAERLAADPSRRLKALGEIEFVPRAERPLMRADNSPLTVAFEDPLLRAAGLGSDRLGDGLAFFELSERQAHRLLCSCMNGWSMEAATTATRVRRIASPDSRARNAILALGVIGTPALAYLML